MAWTAPLHAEPWGPDVADLESLNAAASDAVCAAVRDLRQRGRPGAITGAPPALVAVGPAGVGKTHLFSRLRRKLELQAVLVHLRPLIGADMTPRYLLGQIMQQLGFDSHGVKQVDLLVGSALAVAEGRSARFPATFLQVLRELPEPARRQRVEDVVGALLALHPELEPSFLDRLFQVPFDTPPVRRAALQWLGGRELDEAHAARLGIQQPLPDGAVVSSLRTLAVVAAQSAPLLLVFDQLENLVTSDGARVAAYGNLIAELVDVVKDVAILQLGLSSEWDQRVLPSLGLAQQSRVGGRRITLALPDTAQRRQLLELWVSRIPEQDRPFPWPFSEQQLATICTKDGTTPRMLLQSLRLALDGELPSDEEAGKPPEPPQQVDQDGQLASAWDEKLVRARKELDDNDAAKVGAEPALLFDGLICLGSLEAGIGPMTSANEVLTRSASARGVHSIAFVHQPNATSVKAAFGRVQRIAGEVLVLREQWREWPATWSATRAHWKTLQQRPGVSWHWLQREDTARLLALDSLLKDTRSGDLAGADGKPLTLDQVQAWARRTLGLADWAISRAILGRADPEDVLPAASPPAAAPPTPQPGGTGALQLLQSLRVASLERILRELAHRPGAPSRAAVLAELRGSPAVRWVGDAIVCVEG